MKHPQSRTSCPADSMRRVRFPARVLLGAAVLLGSASTLHAQEAEPPQASEPTELDDAVNPNQTTLTQAPIVTDGLVMNFDQATLKTVLDYLAEEAGMIIVNEVELDKRINIKNAKPIALDDAVDALNTVLFESGYTAIQRGRVLKIVSLEDAKNQSIPVRFGNDPDEIPETDTIVTHVVPIRFANADEIQDDLEDLINDDFAEMTANQSSNAIIITDTQANIRRLVQIIAALDKSVEKVTEVRVFKLEFADADDTARLIESTFQAAVSEDEIVGRLVQQRFGGGGRGSGRGSSNEQQRQSIQPRSQVSAEADSRTNSVVISADPEVMVKIAEVIEDLDSDTTAKDSVLIYNVKNMQAIDLADLFNNLFESPISASNDNIRFRNQNNTAGAGTRVQTANAVAATGNAGAADLVGQVSAVANEDTNTLLVLTPEKNFARVQEILDELDKPVPQVLIRVLVSEVSYDDGLDFGVEFEGINVGSTTNDNILTDFDLFDSTLGLNYLMFDSDNFRLAVRALNATGKFEVLSRPYLLTADNQEATINVGQEVPIPIDSRVTDEGDTITSIEYRDVGITLTVTPQINSEGLVVMDVEQILSAVADQAVPVAPDQDALVFNTRSVNTQVAVAHGQTAVIGGLVQDQLTETVRGVPILRDIPIVGNIFKRTERNKINTELLLFLTPEVIETPEQLTPAADRIKGQSETLDDAYEPGRMRDHLDKLKATPGNPGPTPPGATPEGEDAEDTEASAEQSAEDVAQQEQRQQFRSRLQRWRGEETTR